MKARTRTVVGAALAAAVSCGAALASEKAYHHDVQGRIELARTQLEARGWRMEQVFTGTLPAGQAGWARMDVVPGRTYRVIGRCDHDCRGIDLYLNRDEQPIEIDADHDKLPAVDFDARYTGNFTLTTRMTACAAPACRYGLAVFSR